MSEASENLRNAPVTLSYLNPQTNAYVQMGKTYLCAIRKAGVITMFLLGANRKPVAGVVANASVNWQIQNDIYCSFVDAQNRRFLVLFDSAQEARVFTAIALAESLKAKGTPICIVEKDGPVFPENDRFKVSYQCYDLKDSKVQEPVMTEQDVEVGRIDDSPLSKIAQNGTQGSVFLVDFDRDVVAVVESAVDPNFSNSLPKIPGMGKAKEGDAQGGEGKKRKKKKEQVTERTAAAEEAKPQTEAQAPQQEAQPQTPAAQAQPAQTQPAKVERTERLIPKGDEVKPQPMYDSQLESIRNEMLEKFNELSQMVVSLRRTQAVQNSVALTSDILVSSVQRLLKENQAKDQLIAEKQQLIDLLTERRSDTRERDAMRVKLAELTSKLSAQKRLTKEKLEKQEELNRQIQELQQKIAQAQADGEARLAALHQQLEEEKQRQIEEIEKAKQQLEWNLKAAEEEAVKVREQFNKAVAENKSLKEQSTKDATAELERLKASAPSSLQKTVKFLVSGVYSMIRDNFDEDTEYDGVKIMGAVRLALQKQAGDLLRRLDPNGEGEEDSEEDGDDDEEDS